MRPLIHLFFSLGLITIAHSQILVEDPAQNKFISEPQAESKIQFRSLPEQKLQTPIFRYHPNSIAFGNPDTKVKFSFKFQLAGENAEGLFAGYQQLMFWDILEESSPFRQVEYNPDLFYRLKKPLPIIENLDIGLIEHHSNGESGPSSRSFDRGFIRTDIPFYIGSWGFNWNTKLFAFYNIADENKELQDYTGFFKTSLLLEPERKFRTQLSGVQINLMNRSQELELSARIKISSFYPEIYLQYFNGFAESLVDYDQEDTVVRIGFRM